MHTVQSILNEIKAGDIRPLYFLMGEEAFFIDQISTLTIFCVSLENRARVMSNEMIKIDLLVSNALEIRPDINRIARAENFVEDNKIDTRRD